MMNRIRWSAFVFICLLWAQSATAEPAIERIVSLAPSITETLFALGAGNTVVGVTSYCDYPEAAKELPKVGGFANLHIESIVALQPDVVVLLRGHGGAQQKLERIGLKTLSVDNESVGAILASIETIGKMVGRREEAQRLNAQLHQAIGDINKQQLNVSSPSVLVVVGGHSGSSGIAKVHVAGTSTIYDELIGLAGGRNAYQGKIGYPHVSAEGLIALNPDIIFDLFPNAGSPNSTTADIKRRWRTLSHVRAVREDRVYVIDEKFSVSPGPRVVQTLKLFAEAIRGAQGS